MLTCLAYCLDQELWKAIDNLKEQVKVLKEQQKKDRRLMLSNHQRRRLAAKHPIKFPATADPSRVCRRAGRHRWLSRVGMGVPSAINAAMPSRKAKSCPLLSWAPRA